MWTLRHGIHRGTTKSLDEAHPTDYPTEEEALASFEKLKESYANIGYKIWYATLTGPDGESRTLETNPI